MRVGSGAKSKSKTVEYWSDAAIQSNLLNQTELTEIAAGTDRKTRERDVMNFRGFALKLHATNIVNRPVYFVVAVIGTRDGALVNGTDFFRDPGGDTRYLNFNNTGFTGVHRAYYPINTAKYALLWRKTYKMGNSSNAAGYTSGVAPKNHLTIKKYFRINRQVQYSGSDALSCFNKIHLVWWCVKQDYTAVSPITQEHTLNFHGSAVTYFRDIRR